MTCFLLLLALEFFSGVVASKFLTRLDTFDVVLVDMIRLGRVNGDSAELLH